VTGFLNSQTSINQQRQSCLIPLSLRGIWFTDRRSEQGIYSCIAYSLRSQVWCWYFANIFGWIIRVTAVFHGPVAKAPQGR
jgi:hypothetical protein